MNRFQRLVLVVAAGLMLLVGIAEINALQPRPWFVLVAVVAALGCLYFAAASIDSR